MVKPLDHLAVLFILFSVSMACLSASLLTAPGWAEDVLPARTMQDTVDPVAVINITDFHTGEPLHGEVSNGTLVYLSGMDSYDLNGAIVNTTWEITHNDTSEFIYIRSSMYQFSSLGLYLIRLTVTDSEGNKGVNFTAVVSVLDSDFDELPDWWEDKYFPGLEQDAAGDPDDDGYTNLQEYAAGTDPAVADPPPKGFLEKYWMYVAVAAALTVGAVLAMMPRMKRKRKAEEKKKIEAAIEIEKAIEGD